MHNNHARSFARHSQLRLTQKSFLESRIESFPEGILLFTEVLSRTHERKESIRCQLIGKHRSSTATPHQSETPFAHERSFANKQ